MNLFDRWCASYPNTLLAAALALVVYLPAAGIGLALVALGGGLWLGVRRGRSQVAFLLLAASAAAGGWALRSLPEAGPVWPFAASGSASGWGVVTAEAPVNRAGTAPFRLRVTAVQAGDWEGRADAEVVVRGWAGPAPATGSRWRWKGRLDAGTLVWTGGRAEGWEGEPWRLRAAARDSLRASLAPLGPGPAGLAEALLVGAVDDLTPWEKAAFRQAGCSHVLALSGMHLSLLASLLLGLFRRRAPAWAVFAAIQALLAAFCFLAGPIPSLLRAWVMAALGGWYTLRRHPLPLRELLAQSFVVSAFLWPGMTGSLSYELSFLAMAGLFWWAQRWDRFLRPWLGRWGSANLAASAAALAATVPLTLALFGEVRWIGLLLTPPLVALTTVNLLGAAAVGLTGLWPGLDVTPLAPAFQGLYDLTFSVASWGGQFPPLDVRATLVAAAGALGAAAWFLYTGRHRRVSLPVSLNYDSPAALQAFLDSQGYNALKRWGQNFLINAGARQQILAALDLKPGEPVWEVGPGLGALTHHLVAAGHPLTVFEIDPGYASFLRDEFGSAPSGFALVEGDVVKTWKSQPLTGVKTVGNLPYNAASAIVADFIEGGFFPEVFVVTVQLEMAQRMTASPGSKNYSSFSVLCQSVFQLNDVVTLKPGSFYPAPEVTSRVVRLRPHGRYPGLDHARFSRFVRECFSSRRKTLRNNLPGAASALKVSDAALTQAFSDAGVDLGLRAEALTVDRFVGVFRRLSPPS